jgi:hypothetical protein
LIHAECPALPIALKVEIHVFPKRPMENDSIVGKAWKEYPFPGREEVSALLWPIQQHSARGHLCEEHFEVWQMHAKSCPLRFCRAWQNASVVD